MEKKLERFGISSGIAKITHQEKEIYVVYAEPLADLLIEEMQDGYLGHGIGKSENKETAMKEAIDNLMYYIGKLNRFNSYLQELLEDNDIWPSCEKDTTDFKTIGLFVNLKDSNPDIIPVNDEEKKMLEKQSDAKLWVGSDECIILSPYP